MSLRNMHPSKMRLHVVLAALGFTACCSGMTITGHDVVTTESSHQPATLALTSLPSRITPLSSPPTVSSNDAESSKQNILATDLPENRFDPHRTSIDFQNPTPGNPTLRPSPGEIGFTAIFIQIITFSAPATCRSQWTATHTYSFTKDPVVWGHLIGLATASSTAFTQTLTEPVNRCTKRDCYEKYPQTFSYGSYTTSTTTTSTFTHINPPRAPMFYTLPPPMLVAFEMAYTTTFDGGGVAVETYPPNWRQRLPAGYELNCIAPENLPPGEDYAWNQRNETWEFYGKIEERDQLLLLKILLPVGLVWALGGLLESWFWFGRLMRGRHAARGNSIVWSVGTFFLVRKQRMRPGVEDRRELERRWMEVGYWRALRLWARYGLRWRYPVELLGEFPVEVRGGETEMEDYTQPPKEAPAPVYSKTLPSGEDLVLEARSLRENERS